MRMEKIKQRKKMKKSFKLIMKNKNKAKNLLLIMKNIIWVINW